MLKLFYEIDLSICLCPQLLQP